MTTRVDTVRPQRGRRTKFTAPSRAVTVTLPEHVIEALDAIDVDLSRAIVRLAQPQLRKQPHAPARTLHVHRRGRGADPVRPESRRTSSTAHEPSSQDLLSRCL